MTNAQNIPAAIYVTQTKRGPRFHRLGNYSMRLFPMTREAAEQAFAAGATVYSKQAGESIWQTRPVLITEA